MVLQPKGLALTLVVVSVLMLTFSWLMVVLRMTVRRHIKAVGTDDWLMVAGLVRISILSYQKNGTCIWSIVLLGVKPHMSDD